MPVPMVNFDDYIVGSIPYLLLPESLVECAAAPILREIGRWSPIEAGQERG